MFFFKQKTAYDMRIRYWSSDVCSSDLCEPEGGNRDGEREFEIIARRSEGDRGRARIIGFDELPHPETDDELDNEIDSERDRDPYDIARNGDDLASLEAEHRDDREQQRDQRDRRDFRQEARLVPLIALGAGQQLASQESREERDAEIDENRLGNGPEADVDHAALDRKSVVKGKR